MYEGSIEVSRLDWGVVSTCMFCDSFRIQDYIVTWAYYFDHFVNRIELTGS